MKKSTFALLLMLLPGLLVAVPQEVIDQWKMVMEYGVSEQRKAIVTAIEKDKVKDAYFLLENALINDDNAAVRGQVAYAMINLRITNAAVWLAALEKETDNETLRKVAYGIGALKIPGAGPRLMTTLSNSLNDDDYYLTSAIIRSLGEVVYKPAETLVFVILTNFTKNVEVRGAAAEALGTIGGPDKLLLLKDIVANPGENRTVRMYCAYAMGKSGSSEVMSVIFPIIENEDEDIYIRKWAMAGLAFVNTPEVIKKMIDFTKVDNAIIRLQAIQNLGKLKAREAAGILMFRPNSTPPRISRSPLSPRWARSARPKPSICSRKSPQKARATNSRSPPRKRLPPWALRSISPCLT
jgi:HEAT repeat protein